ncbi:hypothetical protein QJS83_05755 [Bdellovibrio sp. 22V]|uniref:hypothetical protein n=1 Tax=Bdellovibrio TaxID=958 RepID=UPI002543F611|nr:hypothetical protein [Bdellovibrio sp. 22V]WII73374.1 hypothetical protein QJS83_05755 [Bdellovibrio sp. 22V]
MKKIFAALVSLMVSSPAWAYITATYGNMGTDPNTRTHILIVGKGNELSTLLQTSAAAKAKKYAELYPNEQIRLISVNETGGKDNLELLASYGFKNVEEHRGFNFDTTDVMSEMEKFNKIATVDIYSHSVAYYGVILDGKFNRMDPKRDGYQKLANRFTKDAYAYLHGCNSGQFLAPILSLQWNIPVAGSFTSTDFNRLHENGQWYFDDARKPNEGKFVGVNKKTYERNENCSEGACRRLFPDNHNYNGYWGSFSEGGLGFFKFFCMNNTTQDCQKAMARSMINAVSVKPINVNSSLEDYKDVVFDWLCPASGLQEKRDKCRQGLENAVATGGTYDSFGGKSLQCDFKGCKAKFKCQRMPLVDLLRPGSCEVINLRESTKTTTQVNEYKAYLEGFKLLQAGK